MGVINVEKTAMQVAAEETFETLPAAPLWYKLEHNDLSTWGANTTKTERNPISSDRSSRKPTVTGLASDVEFPHDLTRSVFQLFIEGFCFASAVNPYSGGTTRQGRVQAGALFLNLEAVNSTSSFDHDAITTAMTAGRLVYTRGFDTTANNAIWEVDTSSTTTLTEVTAAPTDETPGNTSGATLEIAGHRAAIADLVWTNATTTLSSTALDFTTLGLSPGQIVHIGGLTVTNQFSEGVAYARISPSTAITATAIVFDKVSGTLAADDPGTGETIDLLYGPFIRNVDTTATDFLERSYQFELTLPNLGSGAAARYQYAVGNYCNQITVNLPLEDKATIDFGFVGSDTDAPVASGSRETNAATPVDHVENDAYNTSADIARLRLLQTDEDGLTTCFKNLSLTLNNQVTREVCLGTLGAGSMNFNTFLVNFDAQVLLTNEEVINDIKDNNTVTLDFVIKNDDGAICGDIPALVLEGGDLELPRGETVRINTPGKAFKDDVLGYTVGFSLIPMVP